MPKRVTVNRRKVLVEILFRYDILAPMPIYLIKSKATQQQIEEMLVILKSYIKLAVDVKRRILAGGGELHADCEALLIADGSQQENIWGANWIPSEKKVTYEAMLNIAPRRNNRSMEIQDPKIRDAVGIVARQILDINGS